MTSKAQPLDKTSVSTWLAELHMECYKKNLESFDTIRPLLEIKETELKKLGIHNSKDRAMMMGSLANYRAVQEDSPGVTIQESHKSLLRKGSLKKLNLKSMKKGLLGSGNSRKSKKTNLVLISAPSMPSAIDLTEQTLPPPPIPTSPTSPSSTRKPSIPDYEELPDGSPVSPKPFQTVTRKAVENEYVPSPQNSPQFDTRRPRAYTVGESSTDRMWSDFPPEPESPSGLVKHKHLSLISMESGLSFGYDVEKDFNPALPLESQPWFHGKIPRAEAECLLNDDGDFLVRENVTLSDTFTLSLRSRGDFDHTLIGTTEVVSSNRGFGGAKTAVKYHFDGGAFDSIPELVYNHLKYQIPIDKDVFHVIVNPICRTGTKGQRTSVYMPDDSSPFFNTLPKSFGSKHKKRSASPETGHHHTMRPMKSISISPSGTPNKSPHREHAGLKSSTSIGDILESRNVEAIEIKRNAISPPPTNAIMSQTMITPHSGRRPRASTMSGITSPRQRVDSFGDYEVMESVSIWSNSPEMKRANPSNSSSAESVKYAEIRYPRKKTPQAASSENRTSNAVKYAEIRFSRSMSSNASPHPFSMYDVIPASRKDTNPYQSRAELLAQKLQSEATYSTPRPQQSDPYQHGGLPRTESSPHPFPLKPSSHLPRQLSIPSQIVAKTPIAKSDADATLYTVPEKSFRNRESVLSGLSNRSSPGLTHPYKVLKGLPGYDALVKLHTLLGAYTTEELAYHLTRADAVCFLLVPRVGEDEEVWKNRVQQVTSSSGVYVGLQTLADIDGEKLWKKLYFRHLSFSQTVTLCIVSAGDAVERARMLRRFIELASMLQSGSYGNLFSFIALMHGMQAPQVTAMSDVWELLQLHNPEVTSTHKELMGTISNLREGVSMFASDQLTIPAIQHLKTAFHYEEQPLPGQPPEDYSPLGEYLSLTCGLDGIHNIVSNCSQFCYNCRKRLGDHRYDASLMDFFVQDYTRTYLQHMGVCADSPPERRRRFGVLLDALVDRLESFECL